MKRMTMERLKHEAAKEVFRNTKYNWFDMMDQTEEQDREALKMTEEESAVFWKEYFADYLEAIRAAEDASL